MNRVLKALNVFPFKIYLLALVLRVIPILLLRNVGIGLDDMFQYDMLARSLASGNGYRWYAYPDLQKLEPYVQFDLSTVEYDPGRGVQTTFRAPLYPLFLAAIYLVTGPVPGRFLAARLVQAAFDAALAPLTYLIAEAWLPGETPEKKRNRNRSAVIAGGVIAWYPLLVLYPFGLATENLFIPLLLLSLLFLLRSAANPTLANHLCAGVCLGLANLTRSIILPFAGLALLWAWIGSKQRGRVLAMAAMFLLIVTPWVIRNSILSKRLTGIESSLGYNLYVGYHPESNGSFTFGVSLDLIPILDDAERDMEGTRLALSFIRDDPGRFFTLALNRLGYFFGLEKRVLLYFYSNNFLGYIATIPLLLILLIMFLPFVITSSSAVFGMATLPWDQKTSLIWILMTTFLLPHVLILSEDRFHLAIVPILAIAASHCWVGGRKALQALMDSPRGKAALGVALMVFLLLFLNWGLEISRDADKFIQILGPNGNKLYPPY